MAVRYESEPVAPAAAARGPSIVELSGTPAESNSDLIREPGSIPPPSEPPIPPAPLPRRSQFVPLELSPPAQAIVDSPPPPLPVQPTFDPPAEAPPSGPDLAPAQPMLDIRQGPQPNPPAPEHEVVAPQSSPWQIRDWSPPPAARTHPAAPPPIHHEAMTAVQQRAKEISDRGFIMAQRGMLYAGRAELIKSLQLMAQALDVHEGTAVHATALASGLAALEEARDFVTSAVRPGGVNVAEIATNHQTALLKDASSPDALSPVVAQQQYFAHAQAQLALAVGGQPVSSQTLYRLGRLQTVLAAHDADAQALHAPKAMVFHQAALMVDGANYLAANELGVLLARYGQLNDARRLLVHSVSIYPQAETWHNLAVVHERMGETDLARRAEHERELLVQHTRSMIARQAADLVRWVDPPTFAKSTSRDIR
jgi:hypothetical protein